MSRSLTANEAARQFPDLLDLVQDRGESILITRDGREIAQLTCPAQKSAVTLRALVEHLRATPLVDAEFGEDLRRIRAEQPPMDEDPWDS